MTEATQPFDVEKFFLALADRTRLRLLNLMGGDEVCVCFFVEILNENQPKISRHLAYLRDAGLVAARRDGKWMHYRLVEPSDPRAARVLRDVLAWMREDETMAGDRRMLESICCGPQSPIGLQRAPRPASLG